jgi:exodeoxyribonuclease-3
MKLISWNCQGAFRKKADVILEKNPDLLVVQECEHPDKLVFPSSTTRPTNFLWFGDNPHKGLGIFSYGHLEIKLLPEYDPDYKIVVPLEITDGQSSFTLFAIWANNPDDKANQYIGQVWKAINHYSDLLEKNRTILTGDFNSNKIWDKPRRVGNHTDVVKRLAERDYHSIYHLQSNEEQGKETTPTFFLQRKKEKPYHIDYCFASSDMIDKIKTLQIGTHDDWISHSDHCPLILDFET